MDLTQSTVKKVLVTQNGGATSTEVTTIKVRKTDGTTVTVWTKPSN